MPTKRPPKYRVVNAHPTDTGTPGNPRFGPSGERKGTKEKVYTQADVDSYRTATGEKVGKKKIKRGRGVSGRTAKYVGKKKVARKRR
jgi:hypothetical protein